MRFDAPALGYGIAILEEKCVFEGAPGKGPKETFFAGSNRDGHAHRIQYTQVEVSFGGRIFPPQMVPLGDDPGANASRRERRAWRSVGSESSRCAVDSVPAQIDGAPFPALFAAC